MSLFTKRLYDVLAIGLWAALLGGCSGGGGAGTLPRSPQQQNPVVTTQSTKTASGNVRFAIGIKPRALTGRNAPQYVSLSTESLQILTDGAGPVVVNLTASSPNCSANPAVPGAYICTASLRVPAGDHVFTVTTYDASDAKGNVLSTNTTGTVYVKPTGTTTVSIVLAGEVKYVSLTLSPTNPPVGTAAAVGLTAILEDADQNLIVGPAAYEYPVTLTTSDSTNGPLSKTTLKSPADTAGITANYNGANIAHITYAATATGLSAATVSDAVLAPGASWNETVLYAFDSAGPLSGLIETGGEFYGTAYQGSNPSCSFGCGAVFQLLAPTPGQTAWKERVIYSFTGGSDGSGPTGVIPGAGGALYGTAEKGAVGGDEECNEQGYAGCGTVFRLNPPQSSAGTWTLTTLYSFQGLADGGVPNGGLAVAPNGTLYGTTVVGGPPHSGCAHLFEACGVLFGVSPPGPGQTAWTESVLEPLAFGQGEVASISGLIAGPSGTLYGIITSPDNSCGAVFAFGQWAYNFTGGVDGCSSGASLALDARNNLYVSNTSGGAYGKGVVFQLTSGTVKVLHSFGATPADGTSPTLSSHADVTGALYGATAGGPGGGGTVFQLNPPAAGKTAWSELVLHAFTGHADGGGPGSALFFGANGALYGATNGGGKGYGVVFELTPRK